MLFIACSYNTIIMQVLLRGMESIVPYRSTMLRHAYDSRGGKERETMLDSSGEMGDYIALELFSYKLQEECID